MWRDCTHVDFKGKHTLTFTLVFFVRDEGTHHRWMFGSPLIFLLIGWKANLKKKRYTDGWLISAPETPIFIDKHIYVYMYIYSHRESRWLCVWCGGVAQCKGGIRAGRVSKTRLLQYVRDLWGKPVASQTLYIIEHASFCWQP